MRNSNNKTQLLPCSDVDLENFPGEGARRLDRVAHTSSVRYVKSLVFNYSRTVLLRKHIFFSVSETETYFFSYYKIN